MKTATCKLIGESPYGQSKPVFSKKSRDETHDDFEKRTWQERAHVDAKGMCFIPPMAFKNCLSEAAKYKPIQIPGKGKTTYTKHVEAGVMVVDPVPLGKKITDVEPLKLFVPSDGRRGGTTRVWKYFPVFPEWNATVTYYLYDDLVDDDVFASYLEDAGRFIGIGFFRPRNNGYFGRFSVENIKWST